MDNMIHDIIEWLSKSHRWQHIVFAIIAGALANGWYCCEYGAVGVASALELKDKLYQNKWDWIDWVLTIVGFNLGYFVRYNIKFELL